MAALAEVSGNTPTARTRTWIVPVDGSPVSERALVWTLETLFTEGDAVHLVHIIPEATVVVAPPFMVDLASAKQQEQQEVAQDWALLSERYEPHCQRAGASCKAHILHYRTDTNSLGDAIAKLAQKYGATAVIMAKHNKGRIKQAFLGSATSACLKHCAKPLVGSAYSADPPPTTAPTRAWVVPVDGSPACERALQWTLQTLFREGDAVHLVHVIPEVTVAPPFVIDPAHGKEPERQEVAHARALMSQRCNPRCRQAGAHCKLHIVPSQTYPASIGELIGRLADKYNAAAGRSNASNKTWLVPVDASPASERALLWTLKHLYTTGDTIHLVHVIPELDLETATPLAVYSAGGKDPAKVVAMARTLMSEGYEKHCKQAGASYKVHIVPHHIDTASIGEVIGGLAGKTSATAVIMAKHNKGRIKAALLGSATDACFKHCTKPLVLLRAD
ncbi:hypothetical protein WJX72_000177 [[Myrmecia] bisecta]|uniref:UspA domain-containing protein n=1 Tax=[Myrmecia] bisecta TaxID=41462 RepID=A0AAW1R4M3_9CHLO